MKEVTGIARNYFYTRIDDNTYHPRVEVVVVVSEPVFRVDDAGQLVKIRTTEGLRFTVDPTGLRHLAKTFIAYADEAEGKVPPEADED